MYTGYVLFQNDSIATMLARIQSILGDYPTNVLEQGKDVNKYFVSSDYVIYQQITNKHDREFMALLYPKKTTLEARLHLSQFYNPSNIYLKSSNELCDEELFIDFIRESLNLQPLQRPTATRLKSHLWLKGAKDLDFTQTQSMYSFPPPDTDDVEEADDNDDNDEGEDDDDDDNEEEDDDDDNDEYDEENELSEDSVTTTEEVL